MKSSRVSQLGLLAVGVGVSLATVAVWATVLAAGVQRPSWSGYLFMSGPALAMVFCGVVLMLTRQRLARILTLAMLLVVGVSNTVIDVAIFQAAAVASAAGEPISPALTMAMTPMVQAQPANPSFIGSPVVAGAPKTRQ